MVTAFIIGCEVAFWVVVGLGLLLRYRCELPRLGLVCLALVPVVDVVLLIATAFDLRTGATASLAHTAAVFYLGFSVAYGHRMIAWADARMAHRTGVGPAPEKKYGKAHTRLCWGNVRRTAIAVGIASAAAWALQWWVNDAERTAALAGTYRWSAIIVAVDALYAVSYTLWPRREPKRTTTK